MKKSKIASKFYLDKEKDIVVNLIEEKEDELTYILETPNHNTGNLITNLARICGLKTIKNEKDMKIIKGTIPASINGDNEEVYIFRMGGIKVANIYKDGRVAIKATIPAISKTLMSQTKNYNFSINETLVKSYILKKAKFRTDLHTHMNAMLPSDCLIALGLVHQVRYPLYYIKKLGLTLSEKQEEEIYKQREEVEKLFVDSDLKGKYLTRKIDDNTFINFADFILNNLENATENLKKISKSLEILKDGQAVFTNLEKLYIYRYVFAKGTESKEKIELNSDLIKQIPDKDIKSITLKMLEDKQKESPYCKNNLRQDKLLWIAREYQRQGIYYVEIADTVLTKKGIPAIELLEELDEIMPQIEKETGVKIRFLVAIRRIPLTIIKDNLTNQNYLRENLNVLKAVSKSPYVVGSDFIGEEINDISELSPVIKEIVQYVAKEDNGYTIRIHAGENDSLRDNVKKSIQCIKDGLEPGQKMPRFRLGHGLYTEDLDTEEGKKLIEEMKETGAVLEFQLTSNVRLNNLSKLEKHPLKRYLENDIKCVQGTDGFGFYGTDTIDEQLAMQNLLGLTNEDFMKMRKVEDEIIEHQEKYFKEKSKKFKEFLNGRTIREAILQLEDGIEEESKSNKMKLRLNNNILSEIALKDKIVKLPTDKMPIIIAGGSFNARNRETKVEEKGRELLKKLMQNVDSDKVYFVIGHQMKGYEKEILDIEKEINKKFEVDAIIPKTISEEVKERLLDKRLNGVCISTESDEFGIYKSFNYEIFERRTSIVIAFDGNSPVSNLVQEAKNGKGKSKIYVNSANESLKEKANLLEGYVVPFSINDDIVERILEENPEIR